MMVIWLRRNLKYLLIVTIENRVSLCIRLYVWPARKCGDIAAMMRNLSRITFGSSTNCFPQKAHTRIWRP
jgi:hypothetical protein